METIIREPKRITIQCKGCRKMVQAVAWSQGMSFGECCKHKAPTKSQFNDFVNEHLGFDVYNFATDEARMDKKKKGNNGIAVN